MRQILTTSEALNLLIDGPIVECRTVLNKKIDFTKESIEAIIKNNCIEISSKESENLGFGMCSMSRDLGCWIFIKTK